MHFIKYEPSQMRIKSLALSSSLKNKKSNTSFIFDCNATSATYTTK